MSANAGDMSRSDRLGQASIPKSVIPIMDRQISFTQLLWNWVAFDKNGNGLMGLSVNADSEEEAVLVGTRAFVDEGGNADDIGQVEVASISIPTAESLGEESNVESSGS